MCNALSIDSDASPYFSQTDGSVPNTLVIANVEVVKPRVAAAEHISQVLVHWVLVSLTFNIYKIYLSTLYVWSFPFGKSYY